MIGNGKNVLLWWDKWANEPSMKDQFPRLFLISTRRLMKLDEAVVMINNLEVEALNMFRRQLRSWEQEQWAIMVSKIRDIRITEGREDVLVWNAKLDGKFSTTRATELILNQNQPMQNFEFEFIWKIKVPPKVQSFLWLLVLDRIPSKQMLVDRSIVPQSMDISCSRCGHPKEDSNHILFKCPSSLKTWEAFLKWWEITMNFPNNFAAFFCFLFESGSDKEKIRNWRIAVGATLWTVWSAKNDATFNEKKWSPGEIMFTIKLRSWEWYKILGKIQMI